MGLVATHILNVASGAIDLAAEAIDDRVAALIVAGTGITLIYSDVDGTLTISTGAGGTAAWGGISGTLSSQTDLQSALNAKAALASPTFTGTPAAPTATGGTNTTQIATTAFVQTAVSGVTPSGASIVTSLNVELGSTVWQTHPSGADLVTAINAQIGSTVWQGGGSGTPAWGTIVGTLADQTDLNTALSGKAASSHTHTLSSITDIVVTSDKITFTQGLRPGLYNDLVTPPTGTIFRSANDGHLYFCHDDASVHLLCDSGGYGGGVIDWGDITGTLAFQADLQAELDLKQNAASILDAIISAEAFALSDTLMVIGGASFLNGVSFPSYSQVLVNSANHVAAQAHLQLTPGTNVQAYNADLTAIAGLASAADRLPYFTGSGTAALATFTSAARALLDDSSAAAMRTTLGLGIGTNVQAYSAILSAYHSLGATANAVPYWEDGDSLANMATTTLTRDLMSKSSVAQIKELLLLRDTDIDDNFVRSDGGRLDWTQSSSQSFTMHKDAIGGSCNFMICHLKSGINTSFLNTYCNETEWNMVVGAAGTGSLYPWYFSMGFVIAIAIETTGVVSTAKLIGQTAEVIYTPTVTTQTIPLNEGRLQTLLLTSTTGATTATLTIPSMAADGNIIVKQHASTPRNITWAVSSGSIKWLGTQPTWSSDAVNAVRIVRWRWDGSVMYLESSNVG